MIESLRATHDMVLAELDAAASASDPGASDPGGAGIVLHGDAHGGNLMRSGGR